MYIAEAVWTFMAFDISTKKPDTSLSTTVVCREFTLGSTPANYFLYEIIIFT